MLAEQRKGGDGVGRDGDGEDDAGMGKRYCDGDGLTFGWNGWWGNPKKKLHTPHPIESSEPGGVLFPGFLLYFLLFCSG